MVMTDIQELLAEARAAHEADLERVAKLEEQPRFRPLKRRKNARTLHYLEHAADIHDPETVDLECDHSVEKL